MMMPSTNNTTDSDPDFRFPYASSSSSSLAPSSFPPVSCHKNPKKKRSKFIKIAPSLTAAGPSTVSKPKYAKKPDPSAPKITRPCSECGKKFWSWKALFGHMRCHPERQWRGINPPPHFQRTSSPTSQAIVPVVEALMTEDDHEVAECLLLLANGCEFSTAGEVACATGYLDPSQNQNGGNLDAAANCRFECSGCKKVFGSHQALGGHRASHKNVKGCFAIEDHGNDDGDGLVHKEAEEEDSSKMMMVLSHQCSICLRVFSSGQALGGHKRCHWERIDEPSPNQGAAAAGGGFSSIVAAAKNGFGWDLNLPPPVDDVDDDDSCSHSSSGLTLDLRLGL